MVVPEQYSRGLDSHGFVSVTLGYNGIELFPREAIEARQVGYSVDPTGRSLCDGSPGAWEKHWLVIGTESLCGDPVILDTLDPNLRVLYDIHGQGKWEPMTVAPSLDGFWKAFRELNTLSAGRENPISLEANPIGAEEKSEFLGRLTEIIGTDEEVSQFWMSMLENEA
jgi:hypothetical protein